jgi:hypothetical protein
MRLIQLYWDVGKMIVNRQRKEGWGKSIVDKLVTDLQKNFPGIEGFSSRNIWRMRAFYIAWVRDKPQPKGAKRGRLRSARVPPRERELLPRAVAEIPWVTVFPPGQGGDQFQTGIAAAPI